MENIYLIIVVLLFLFAISDLIVGVSNDAVNFLNSAIGSKAAPIRIIMITATLGIVVGATFSSGMMEVARKGIFNPERFYFSEVMIIFLAVMITDIILLDLFNTFGLPTSTTVSIVFELLGAALGISVLKLRRNPEMYSGLNEFINSAKALEIISGIILSVGIAFTAGAIIQYIARLIFSFNYHRPISIKKSRNKEIFALHSTKILNALWTGIAITAITNFMLIKGAKGASFMTEETTQFILSNKTAIITWSFIGWSLLFYLLQIITSVNVHKIIVICGTFALAMAFAGNDLVNFIGVPLAGFSSFRMFNDASGFTADNFLMTGLQGEAKTPTLFLLLAGIIMVVTLWISKKAKSVVKTTVDLSSQDRNEERFGSSMIARALVRESINFWNGLKKIIPNKFLGWIDQRFTVKKSSAKEEKKVAFDLIRASVNLVVASILIAMGTSRKIPLSTTYVTFMVAMGTSLADRAWNRESAVYRITGVFTVVGGWFFTAFSAFTSAFIMAIFIHWGGIWAILLLVVLALFLITRTYIIHRRRTIDEQDVTKDEVELVVTHDSIIENCTENIVDSLTDTGDILPCVFSALFQEKRKKLINLQKRVNAHSKKIRKLKKKLFKNLQELKEESIESGHFYIQVVDNLYESSVVINNIWQAVFDHINNNHAPLIKEQKAEFDEVIKSCNGFIDTVAKSILRNNFENKNSVLELSRNSVALLDKTHKKQVALIKKNEISTRNATMVLRLIYEIKNLIKYSENLYLAQESFVSNTTNTK